MSNRTLGLSSLECPCPSSLLQPVGILRTQPLSRSPAHFQCPFQPPGLAEEVGVFGEYNCAPGTCVTHFSSGLSEVLAVMGISASKPRLPQALFSSLTLPRCWPCLPLRAAWALRSDSLQWLLLVSCLGTQLSSAHVQSQHSAQDLALGRGWVFRHLNLPGLLSRLDKSSARPSLIRAAAFTLSLPWKVRGP